MACVRACSAKRRLRSIPGTECSVLAVGKNARTRNRNRTRVGQIERRGRRNNDVGGRGQGRVVWQRTFPWNGPGSAVRASDVR